MAGPSGARLGLQPGAVGGARRRVEAEDLRHVVRVQRAQALDQRRRRRGCASSRPAGIRRSRRCVPPSDRSRADRRRAARRRPAAPRPACARSPAPRPGWEASSGRGGSAARRTGLACPWRQLVFYYTHAACGRCAAPSAVVPRCVSQRGAGGDAAPAARPPRPRPARPDASCGRPSRSSPWSWSPTRSSARTAGSSAAASRSACSRRRRSSTACIRRTPSSSLRAKRLEAADPAVVEDLARRKLEMMKPGEVLFIDGTPAAPTDTPAPSTSR